MHVSDSLELSAVVWREEALYVALCPELDVASQGKSVEEALSNLREALELYLDDEDAEELPKREVEELKELLSAYVQGKREGFVVQNV